MRRLVVVVGLLVGCKGSSAPAHDAPPRVIADAAPIAKATPPPDAHPPEKVVYDGGTDTTSAASMVKAEGPTTPATPASSAVATTIEKPFPHGDAHDAVVAVARDTDAPAMVKHLLDDAGVAIPTDRRIVVKINLTGFDRMKPGKKDDGVAGRITDLAFVRALLVELEARGVKVENLAVADGGADEPGKLEKVMALSGYGPVLDELHVRFLDLDHVAEGDPPKRAMHLPYAHLLKDGLVVSGWLVDPDHPPFLIDVAKMKTHRFAVMTMSIKNLMGAIQMGGGATPEKKRWKMHAELAPWLNSWKATKADDRDAYRAALKDFSERLADVYGAIAPDLAIVEGLPPEQGDGFAKVVPYGDGPIAIASANGCYADYVAATYFQLADSDALEQEIGYRMPPAIAAVADRYFGGSKALKKVKIVGDTKWKSEKRAPAWYKAMAPFQLNPP